jgi:4-hydroxybutyrate CoA-transferase
MLNYATYKKIPVLTLKRCSRPDYSQSFFTNNFFVGGNQREAVAQGYSSLVPVFLSEVPKLLKNGPCTPDWVLLNVSPPDRHGYCSLGVEVYDYY